MDNNQKVESLIIESLSFTGLVFAIPVFVFSDFLSFFRLLRLLFVVPQLDKKEAHVGLLVRVILLPESSAARRVTEQLCPMLDFFLTAHFQGDDHCGPARLLSFGVDRTELLYRAGTDIAFARRLFFHK